MKKSLNSSNRLVRNKNRFLFPLSLSRSSYKTKGKRIGNLQCSVHKFTYQRKKNLAGYFQHPLSVFLKQITQQYLQFLYPRALIVLNNEPKDDSGFAHIIYSQITPFFYIIFKPNRENKKT